jgi:hypothetical protein
MGEVWAMENEDGQCIIVFDEWINDLSIYEISIQAPMMSKVSIKNLSNGITISKMYKDIDGHTVNVILMNTDSNIEWALEKGTEVTIEVSQFQRDIEIALEFYPNYERYAYNCGVEEEFTATINGSCMHCLIDQDVLDDELMVVRDIPLWYTAGDYIYLFETPMHEQDFKSCIATVYGGEYDLVWP